MQKVIITRGIPASGKSTFAKALVQADHSFVRVNRDDIRLSMFGRLYGMDERVVTAIEDAVIRAALKAGKSVVVDATHIPHSYIRRVVDLATEAGAEAEIREFPISLEEALKRNKERHQRGGAFVPEDVIRKMHQRLQDSGPYVI